ncbi:hypothetical protein H5410_025413 [Solanum commersonii]|uniref:Uncharacterized protein n=1 Tax=Solanum commersonii TaxID=4109 RepID=A0A9J5YTP7_SOLCO|nr:hypothetical protein H5410_025413 [Solanum commersonii]
MRNVNQYETGFRLDMIKCELMKPKIGQIVFDSRPKRDYPRQMALEVGRKLQILAVGTSSCGGLGKLSVWGSNTICGITNVGLSAITHGCPSLRGFWVMDTAQGLQSLASLTITSCGVTDLSLEAVGMGCTNIKSMCLRECFVSDGGLVAFAQAAGSLEYLLLEDCSQPC